MKTMLMFDLLTAKKLLPSQIILAIIVTFIFTASTGSPAAIIPILTVMTAYSTGFTLVAYDERNNWEKLRLTMPLSRANIICGRYATFVVMSLAGLCLGSLLTAFIYGLSLLMPTLPFLAEFAGGIEWQIIVAMLVAGLCSSLFLWIIVLPIVARFGMTKAVRFIPIAFIAFIPIGSALAQTAGGTPAVIIDIINWAITPAGTISLALIVIAAVAVLFALSCLLSVKLYEKREF